MNTNVAESPGHGGRPVVVVVGAGSKHGRVQQQEGEEFVAANHPKAEAQEESSSETASTNTNTNVNADDDTCRNKQASDRNRWGLGGALALTFAKLRYDVVLMGRQRDVLDDVKKLIEEELQHQPELNLQHIDGATATTTAASSDRVILCVECDVTDDDSVQNAFESCQRTVLESFGGFLDLVGFNAAAPYPPNFRFAGWGDVVLPHQVDIPNLNQQYDTQVKGLIRCSKHVLPGMLERKRGCILVSGESICNMNGRYEFGSVAPPRAALRSLTQVMFSAYGPMGIHVCHVNIGGIIDTPKTRSWKLRDDLLVDPHAIAEEYKNVYRQHPTVWSYELQLTPSFAARKIDMRM